ncbi:MAG: SulP family inorganic anion transporter [Elainellaceae cyanobacterium]
MTSPDVPPPDTPSQPADLLRSLPFSDELHPSQLVPSLAAGAVTGIIGVIRAISYAAIIFSGTLSAHLHVGVGLAVFSSAVISVVVALTSSLPGIIATPLAAPTAVLAVLAAALAETLSEAAAPQEVVVTVVAAIALGTALTGVILWVLGALKWGEAAQVIPYPVVGGFMAGTGWLVVQGAIKVMTGEALTLPRLGWFLQTDPCLHWLSGLLIALVLFGVSRWVQHYLVLPGLLLAATALFFGVTWSCGLSFDAAHEQGWLLGPFPEGNLWQPLTGADLALVHWGAIAPQSGTLGLLIFVSFLSLVLTNSGLELALDRELDLNRELQAVGLANLAAGLGSTMAGNQALPSTLLAHKMGAGNRLTGVFKAIPCLVVLVLGPSFLAYFPKPILGSLLLFLGIDLLWTWLIQGWSKFPPVDYLIVLSTLVTIGALGFLPGILVGLGLTVLQFLYQCSQAQALVPSTAALSGAAVAIAQAHQDRLHPDQAQTAGRPAHRAVLQGFLFFGNAASLFQSLRRSALEIPAASASNTFILDFSRVMGLDSSAVLTFKKLLSLAQRHDITLIYVGLSDAFKIQLVRGEGLDLSCPHCQMFESSDYALGTSD